MKNPAMLTRCVPIFVGVLLAGLAIAATPADAVQYKLDIWNNSQLQASGDHITVDVELVGGKVTLTVRWHQGAGPGGGDPLTALGIDTFFYNHSAKILSTSGGFADSKKWNFDGDVADGFEGKFGSKRSEDPGGTGGIAAAIVFTIDSSDTSKFTEFAIHIRYSNGCSGWASNRKLKDPAGDAPVCNPPLLVSEPSVLALSGLGLLAAALLGRRLRRGQDA